MAEFLRAAPTVAIGPSAFTCIRLAHSFGSFASQSRSTPKVRQWGSTGIDLYLLWVSPVRSPGFEGSANSVIFTPHQLSPRQMFCFTVFGSTVLARAHDTWFTCTCSTVIGFRFHPIWLAKHSFEILHYMYLIYFTKAII